MSASWTEYSYLSAGEMGFRPVCERCGRDMRAWFTRDYVWSVSGQRMMDQVRFCCSVHGMAFTTDEALVSRIARARGETP